MLAPVQTVLLVDDEEDILVALQRYFQTALPGARILTAHGGQAALDVLRQGGVDVLLTDYKMPKMDGLELVTAAAGLVPDVPRLMMTAFPDMELAIKALNDGRIQHFLTKPIEPEMARDVVKAFLDERLARRQREAALSRSLQEMKKRAPPGPGPF